MQFRLFALAIASLAIASAATAQIRFQPYVGYGFRPGVDLEESIAEDETVAKGGIIVGLGVVVPVMPGALGFDLSVRPSVETVIIGGEEVGGLEFSQSALQANLDLLAQFAPPMSPFAPYAGVGAAFGSFSGDLEDTGDVSDTAFGANVLAGARFGGGFIAPFVEARYTLMSISPEDEDGTEIDPDNSIGGGLSILAGASIGI
jgi:hypothetical protein